MKIIFISEACSYLIKFLLLKTDAEMFKHHDVQTCLSSEIKIYSNFTFILVKTSVICENNHKCHNNTLLLNFNK